MAGSVPHRAKTNSPQLFLPKTCATQFTLYHVSSKISTRSATCWGRGACRHRQLECQGKRTGVLRTPCEKNRCATFPLILAACSDTMPPQCRAIGATRTHCIALVQQRGRPARTWRPGPPCHTDRSAFIPLQNGHLAVRSLHVAGFADQPDRPLSTTVRSADLCTCRCRLPRPPQIAVRAYGKTPDFNGLIQPLPSFQKGVSNSCPRLAQGNGQPGGIFHHTAESI